MTIGFQQFSPTTKFLEPVLKRQDLRKFSTQREIFLFLTP